MSTIANKKKLQHKDAASFRDSSGYIYYENGEIFRHVSPEFYSNYKNFVESGLKSELTQRKMLINADEHWEEDTLTLKPIKIPFISYPAEWSFGQLKAAALLTLEIQKSALEHGMQLKDASVYNIQFWGSQPIFIDTLSFEAWDEKSSWIGYKQFCQHFLAPLTICSFTDARLKSLFLSNLDGIPLDLAINLLPKRAFFNFHRFLHLWMHGKYLKKTFLREKKQGAKTRRSLPSNQSMKRSLELIESLKAAIQSLKRKEELSVWDKYYQGDSYDEVAFKAKEAIVYSLIKNIKPLTLLDLGANDGRFTKIASAFCSYCVAIDFDLNCIEHLFLKLQEEKSQNILPLHMDLANPTPGIGWCSRERKGLIERGPCHTILALAVIHHLLVTAAIPLEHLVSFFSSMCNHLVIEYVPPNDPKFREIAQSNPNDFSYLTPEYFTSLFRVEFDLIESIAIEGSSRKIFHFKLKDRSIHDSSSLY